MLNKLNISKVMKIFTIRFFINFTFVLFSVVLLAQEHTNDYNCFSVLVGKDASVDGSVMLAHNEDDSGNRMVNWYKVTKPTESNKSILLKRGGTIDQVSEVNAYLWFEIPELEFSDSYINEFGVTITSNACPSKEDNPELTDGGIGYWLRRLMAERAFTAKEAVKIGGQLIEELGYASSGRTYVIAGPYETWMLSVVHGKHWIAQRVPDNHVAIIPNYYTITNIDLSDTTNFLGSLDIIDYAIERGWYNADTDGDFDFRNVYGKESSLDVINNKARHWVTLNTLSMKQYKVDDVFPFSFVPKRKVTLPTLFSILRNHYEDTKLDKTAHYSNGSPHKQDLMTVCSNTNQYGFVAQLRNWMPTEIGAVLWMSPSRPCTTPFIPIYSGITVTPKLFAVMNHEKALATHFNELRSFYLYNEHLHLKLFQEAQQIDRDYINAIVEVKKERINDEDKLLLEQKRFEEKMMKLYLSDAEKVKEKLTKYTNDLVKELFEK